MAAKKSRLARKEELRSIRQAIFYGGLTVILSLTLIFLGIPALIRLAVFLGNLRSSSISIENKDTIPPAPPRVKFLPEATNSAQINIQGFAEPGSTVKIFLNGISEGKTVADTNGSFTFTNITLVEGKNEVYALATDEAGNTSQESQRLTVFYDETLPMLEIYEPNNNESFWGEKNKIEVKGRTEENALVYINQHLVIVGVEGRFQYPIVLQEGENHIKVVAIDKAGNKTEKEIKINYFP